MLSMYLVIKKTNKKSNARHKNAMLSMYLIIKKTNKKLNARHKNAIRIWKC